ncbi:platelet factor 4-like [Chanos chanos]|uniref:Platelet factor 4-like n=1 Tax=Chanos chanos TaxID=29144 RepID=A0A6J2W095_CHACN|nr:platelet factor 4-like [Chanos chanos]
MKICLILGFIYASVLLSRGIQPLGGGYNSHCRCQKLESRVIPQRSLRSVEILRRGPHCRFTEVIAGLVNGMKICLDPQTLWVRKLIRFIEKRNAMRA